MGVSNDKGGRSDLMMRAELVANVPDIREESRPHVFASNFSGLVASPVVPLRRFESITGKSALDAVPRSSTRFWMVAVRCFEGNNELLRTVSINVKYNDARVV